MNPIIPFFIRSACNAFPPSEGTSVNKMNLLHTTISFSFTPSMPFPSLPLYPPHLPPPLSCTPRPLCASRAGDDKHLSPSSVLSLALLPPPLPPLPIAVLATPSPAPQSVRTNESAVGSPVASPPPSPTRNPYPPSPSSALTANQDAPGPRPMGRREKRREGRREGERGREGNRASGRDESVY